MLRVEAAANTCGTAEALAVTVPTAAVEAKVIEMQAEEAAKQKESLDKLAALGLTPEDLRRILG